MEPQEDKKKSPAAAKKSKKSIKKRKREDSNSSVVESSKESTEARRPSKNTAFYWESIAILWTVTRIYMLWSTSTNRRSAILNINQEANWQLIKQRKQALINKGNQKENCSRQSNMYCTGDKVLLKNTWKTKFN